jgi:cytochrome P450
MFRLLAENQNEWESLRSHPERSGDVAEEALRLAAPTQGMFRIATEDISIGSKFIPAGSRIVLMYAAANRDPDVWKKPDVFQPGRENKSAHLSFGRGPHFCVGAGLARLETRIVAEEMSLRLQTIEVTNAEQLRYQPSFVLRGLERLDVTVTAKEVVGRG